MKVEVRMAIFSHLSDAQESIYLGARDKANIEINYAKRILNYYQDDIRQYAEEDELTKVCLWELRRRNE